MINLSKKTSPTKVIIFTGAISSGGAEKQSILLAKSLKNRYEVLLVSYFGNRELKRYIDLLNNEGINYCQLKGNALKRVLSFGKLLKTFRPHAIINFLPSNNVIGGFFGRLYNVNVIVGGVRSSRQSFVKYIELLMSHHLFNHVTVFNNHAGFHYFTKKGFTKRKSEVIHNCIYPIPTGEKIFGKSKGQDINILIVSRFEVYKDYYTALKTFKQSLSEVPEYKLKLYIVGTGSLEGKIREWVKSLELENHTEIALNPENIFDFYQKADIFLQTSLFEGFSNSIMEAMSYSLPIVATNVGDNHVLVKEGENGFLTEVKNSNLLSSRMVELIRSEDLRKEMGQKSLEIIKKDYSLEKFANKFSKIIDKII